MGNCPWTSPETAVWAFLNLWDFRSIISETLIIPTSLTDKQIKKIEKSVEFNVWLAINQMFNLEIYRGIHWLRPTQNPLKVQKSALNRQYYSIDNSLIFQATTKIESQIYRISKSAFANQPSLDLRQILSKPIPMHA